MTVGSKRIVLVACWLLACSQDVDTGRRCEPADGECFATPRASAGASGLAGSGGAPSAGAGGSSSVGNSDIALSVHVEDVQQMKIEIVTLACAGDCADIEAVASGGNPPYTFAWEDGSTSAARHVCLDADAQLTVRATDTAVADDEFHYDAQTASTDVTARVLDCGDAGAPSSGLCLENLSFEGTPNQFVTGFDAPPWNGCESDNPDLPGFPSTPDIVAQGSLTGLQPTDGMTYAQLGWSTPLHEFITQKLCEPMRAGGAYSFLIDLSSRDDIPSQLEVYGSANDCGREELLWTSEPLATGWKRVCITLRPTRDAAYFTLNPTGPTDGDRFVLVDNMLPVEVCP